MSSRYLTDSSLYSIMLPESMITSSSLILPDQTCKRLTFAQIQLATNDFEEALVIGRGGFGNVYKSLTNFGLSVDGVAIKRLHSASNQGAHGFEVEVKLLSPLRHGNLAPLIGYCSEGKEMMLAYEFMPNGTLEDHLHRGVSELSWLQRLKICIGAARGLDYLHSGSSTQHEVIHRDVRTSNILLDSNFAAKISDFGLAKVGAINRSQTHVDTKHVKGTFGYIDPYYYYNGKLTRNSDVYAFGVVLLEVLTGKQAVDPTLELSLAEWAQGLFERGRLDDIVSHRLTGQISKKCLKEFASMAVQCLHFQPRKRPTMAEVVVKLESILKREREKAGSGVSNGRLVINKLRYFFRGKVDLMHAKEDKAAHVMLQDRETESEIIKLSDDREIRSFTYAELVRARNKWNYHNISTEAADVGLAMCVRTKDIGTSKLDLKSEEVNHPNLVNLLGYWLNEQKLSCVYERIPERSLAYLLYPGNRVWPPKPVLSWAARLKIAVGAAQGLSFLHKRGHPAYSQFKTDCILVDPDYNARLWDFEVDNSFVTLGSYSFETNTSYAAPEWYRYQADVKMEGLMPFINKKVEDVILEHHFNGGFGMKSEIYSFGVVLLEILTGMNADGWIRGNKNLVAWATPLLAHEANLGMIFDPKLQLNNHPPKGAFILAKLVSKCLQQRQDERPSMEEVSQVLRKC